MSKIQADKWFSLFIRLRDSDENGMVKCCSCGAVHYFRNVDAGHFVNRRHMALRYSEENVHGQCRQCNRFTEGNITGYSLFMINKYGADILQKFHILKNKTMKFGNFELKVIAENYKQKAKYLAKQKNITL